MSGDALFIMKLFWTHNSKYKLTLCYSSSKFNPLSVQLLWSTSLSCVAALWKLLQHTYVAESEAPYLLVSHYYSCIQVYIDEAWHTMHKELGNFVSWNLRTFWIFKWKNIGKPETLCFKFLMQYICYCLFWFSLSPCYFRYDTSHLFFNNFALSPQTSFQ